MRRILLTIILGRIGLCITGKGLADIGCPSQVDGVVSQEVIVILSVSFALKAGVHESCEN
jgi:hypothetical protein